MLQYSFPHEAAKYADSGEGLPDGRRPALNESPSDAIIAERHLRGALSAFDRGAYDGLSQDLRLRLKAHLKSALRHLTGTAA
jgi:hypothetical protein